MRQLEYLTKLSHLSQKQNQTNLFCWSQNQHQISMFIDTTKQQLWWHAKNLDGVLSFWWMSGSEKISPTVCGEHTMVWHWYPFAGQSSNPLSSSGQYETLFILWEYLVYCIQQNILNGQKNLSTCTKQWTTTKLLTLSPCLQYYSQSWWMATPGGVIFDNDMILGNLCQYLTPEILNHYDIISPWIDEYTWGPFMLYHNTPIINRLFHKAEHPLLKIFDNDKLQVFDKWGNFMHKQLLQFDHVRYLWKIIKNLWLTMQGWWHTYHLGWWLLKSNQRYPRLLYLPFAFTTTLQEQQQNTLLFEGECGFYWGTLFGLLICQF